VTIFSFTSALGYIMPLLGGFIADTYWGMEPSGGLHTI